MSRDFSEAIRTVDTLQNRMDEVFHRPNADPVYHTQEAIADAISDNLRYFDADRKAELVEIFFAILEQVYFRMVKPEEKISFCNPAAPVGKRLPEVEMLFRDMMPMAWALSAAWNPPELKNTYCEYFQSFSEEESLVLLDTLEFLAGLFEELSGSPLYPDVHEFWTCMAKKPECLREEDDEARSKLLTVLLEKKMASNAKRKE
jgi:hypothetical protein